MKNVDPSALLALLRNVPRRGEKQFLKLASFLFFFIKLKKTDDIKVNIFRLFFDNFDSTSTLSVENIIKPYYNLLWYYIYSGSFSFMV